MTYTITTASSFNAHWVVSVPAGYEPAWITTNTNYWIGDNARTGGLVPVPNLDFGSFANPNQAGLDLGNN